MNSTTQEAMEVVDDNHGDVYPKWVAYLLEQTFFEKCLNHDVLKCDLNRYCVTCKKSICRTCISDGYHSNHKILTIYRHVYQDVVPLCELESLIDCTKIQPYKCNKKWVVSLTPLPHNGSGLLIEGDGACIICKRKLTDPERFRLCSIACKIQQILDENMVPPRVWTSQKKGGAALLGTRRDPRRSRKGVPRRAPFF